MGMHTAILEFKQIKFWLFPKALARDFKLIQFQHVNPFSSIQAFSFAKGVISFQLKIDFSVEIK